MSARSHPSVTLTPAVLVSLVGRATSTAVMVILSTMTVMPLSAVKANLSELVGRVHALHERVTVTVHGEPSAVPVAPYDLESLEETVAILSDPDTLQRLATSDAELARGEGEPEARLARAMPERRRNPA